MLGKRLRSTVSNGPENEVVQALSALLRSKGWYVVKIPGTKLMSGMPDLYATHRDYRQRWIEVKDPAREGKLFTPAQMSRFPELSANGTQIWVLTGATLADYELLFLPPNWKKYV